MAGLVYMDGFETYGANGDTGTGLHDLFSERFTSVSLNSAAKLSSNAYEGEGLCLDCVSGSSSYYLTYSSPDPSDEVIIGFAVYLGTGTANGYIYAAGTGTQRAGLYYLPGTDSLRIYSLGASVDTANGLLTPDEWHYIEFAYKVHDTTGYWKLWIDGAFVDERTDFDTNGSSSYTTEIAWHTIYMRYTGMRIDDMYIYNNAGGAQSPYGPVKIRTLTANGDDTSDWTSTGANHYDQVNDIPTDTANYVESDTANDVDLFTFANSVTPDHWPIYGVQLNIHAAVTDVGLFTLEGIADSNGTQDVISEAIVDDLGGEYNFVFEEDPETSNAWTVATLNNAIFGVGVE